MWSSGVAALLLTALVTTALAVSGEEWCWRCACQHDDALTLGLNCSRRGLARLLDQWPQSLVASADVANKHFLVSFNGNNITHLTRLPAIVVRKLAFNINRCQISEIDSGAFADVENMVFLDLSDNKLTGDAVRSDIFRGPLNGTVYEPINLETLHLGNNQIHSLDKRLFEYTPHLHTLALNNNPLMVLDSVTILAISSANELKVLDLSNTGIDHIPDDMFRNLKKLQQIDLSGNNFIEIPGSLGLLGQSLVYLTINNNPLERLDCDSFLGMHTLTHLEITQAANLSSIEADTFSQLTNLKVLNLKDNPALSYIDSLAFGTLVNEWPIKEVQLANDNLSDLPVNLMPWKLIDNLSLSNNPWHCNCALYHLFRKKEIRVHDQPTCMSPPKLSGTMLTELLGENCKSTSDKDEMVTYRRGQVVITLPRINTVFIGMGFVTLVAVIGAVIGILGGYIKNKIRTKLMFQPIRYTNITNV